MKTKKTKKKFIQTKNNYVFMLYEYNIVKFPFSHYYIIYKRSSLPNKHLSWLYIYLLIARFFGTTCSLNCIDVWRDLRRAPPGRGLQLRGNCSANSRFPSIYLSFYTSIYIYISIYLFIYLSISYISIYLSTDRGLQLRGN